jgi:hypothetical protein
VPEYRVLGVSRAACGPGVVAGRCGRCRVSG